MLRQLSVSVVTYVMIVRPNGKARLADDTLRSKLPENSPISYYQSKWTVHQWFGAGGVEGKTTP